MSDGKVRTHWHSGGCSELNEIIDKFVDDSVYEGLKEYVNDIGLQVGLKNPDELYVYLAEGRGGDDDPGCLGKAFSIRKELHDHLMDYAVGGAFSSASGNQGAEQFVTHIETLAKELRATFTSWG